MQEPAPGAEIARFGLIADPHVADKDTSSERVYRDSDDKMTDAVAALNADNDIDFVISIIII